MMYLDIVIAVMVLAFFGVCCWSWRRVLNSRKGLRFKSVRERSRYSPRKDN